LPFAFRPLRDDATALDLAIQSRKSIQSKKREREKMSFLNSFEDKAASRRQFGHVLLAGAVGVALTACGGGSDPTGVTDDDSTKNEPDLRKAYDGIVQGTLRADVIDAVGVNPNDGDSESGSGWAYSTETLVVDYYGTSNEGGLTVSFVRYRSRSGANLAKSFDR
jgi:hypothetical protein